MGAVQLVQSFDRIAPLVFRLDIPVGDEAYGTGFFISAEFALTAFHNLYPSVLDNPDMPLYAMFQGRTIEFVQALSGDEDRAWQKKYDVAVLRALKPLDAPPTERFLYLDAAWTESARDDRWRHRDVVAVGLPSNSDQITPIPGITPTVHPLVDATRIVGGKTEVTIPAALHFTVAENDANNAYGMSGSPVYDKERGGIIGVVIAVKKEFYATELVHVVKNWRAGAHYFENFDPRATVVAEEAAMRRPSWRLPVGIGILAAAIALGSVSWLTSGRLAPKQLEVELVRNGTSRTRITTDRIDVVEGEKLRLLITSPTDGYMYVVDREVTLDGAPRAPYLAFPTLSTGAGRNKVTPGMVVSFPDPSDRSSTIEAKPSHLPDPEYGGELLSVLVYGSQLPIDHLEPQPIPLTPEQFPGDGARLLFASKASPIAVKTIKLIVLRASETRQP